MRSDFDRDLDGLPPDAREQVWRNRIEAVVFASAEPVSRAVLKELIGSSCDLDTLVEQIQASLATRPFDLVEVVSGFQFRTRPEYADAIRKSGVFRTNEPDLSERDLTVLLSIAYFQPVTRTRLGEILGRTVSRDVIAILSRRKLIAAGPRSPTPGAPYTYVTTPKFLESFGLKSLLDLPDTEKLAEAGLLTTHKDDALGAIASDFEDDP